MHQVRKSKVVALRIAKNKADTIAVEYAFLGAFIALVGAFIISLSS